MSAEPAAVPPQVPQGRSGGLYTDATDGLKAVRDDFHYWTEKLTDSSFELSLAVIAANWAAFGSLQRIQSNPWALRSLVVVVVGLLLSLLSAKWMSEMHRGRAQHAAQDPARWERECQAALGQAHPWPFTHGIERLGRLSRELKTWLPVAGGLSFLVALLS